MKTRTHERVPACPATRHFSLSAHFAAVPARLAQATAPGLIVLAVVTAPALAEEPPQLPSAAGIPSGGVGTVAEHVAREIENLVARLGAVDAAARTEVLLQLAAYGDTAVDVLLEQMRLGRLDRRVALAAVAAIQSGAIVAPQPDGAVAPSSGEPSMQGVTGVADDDALNIRDAPGPAATIIARFAHDAADIRPSGLTTTTPDGTTWVEVLHAGLPDGRGWVDAGYLEPAAATATAGPSPVADEDVLDAFFPADYAPMQVETVQAALQAGLEGDPGSVFLPGAGIGPLAKALLMVEAVEGALPHARYRLRYGIVELHEPPGAAPVPVSLVQVDRFNLGPVIHAETAAAHGVASTAPKESFGVGPDVSWRLALRPLRGTTALPVRVARAEIAKPQAEEMDCLGVPCRSAGGIGGFGAGLDWQAAEAPPIDFTAHYQTLRDGVPSPAAVVELLEVMAGAAAMDAGGIRWSGYEPREGVAPGEPFVEVTVQTGLGQDAMIEGALRDDNLMDHLARTAWYRLFAVATGPDQPPLSRTDQANVGWRD
jgi:hypothetical protein